MDVLSMVLAVLAGVFTTIETAINAQLGKIVTPNLATLHSLLIGSFMMFIICFNNGSIFKYTKVLTLSPILWIGGIFGAFIILFSSIAIPKLGISNALILILSGQLVSGLIMDVYVNDIVIGTKKILGFALFIIGTIVFLKD